MMSEALTERGIENTLITIHGGGHGFDSDVDLAEVGDALVTYEIRSSGCGPKDRVSLVSILVDLAEVRDAFNAVLTFLQEHLLVAHTDDDLVL